MIETIALLMGGLAALLIGGELLVRGAVGLAERAGVTPLIVGLVIVGFGTSAPELVASVEAALAGSPAIAWGNIVGSNIANSLLILGAAALLAPIAVRAGSALRDSGVALAASAMLIVLAVTGLTGIWIGVAMVAALVLYIAYCYRQERVDTSQAAHSAPHDRSSARELADPALHPDRNGWGKPIVLTLIGLALLVVGGRLLVTGAIDLARVAGLSETLIGLTIVAIGTSLPELVTSLVAARKGQSEVAFGNVVGSNIYNILGIGGVTMIVAPGAIPESLWPLDLGIMAASAALIVGLIAMGRGIGRAIGGTLVLAYAAFLVLATIMQ
ncbi:calcium/sodium antiporter [Qipengyuania sp.]|uniref:calcium/sodium antiporter n=1 Tax=Qipengyuania sp. TaxID=2004515 RepID=UPI0035C8698F